MATKQTPVSKDLRQTLRRLQILETQLWDGKLEPIATRKALEQVSKGQFELAAPKKPRRPRKPVYGHFTPVENYAELIAARRDLRGWQVTDELINQFAHDLVPHSGRLAPTSARFWLGGDLRYNWDEFRLWALEEAAKADLMPNDWVASMSASFWPGSERTGEPSLGVCGLNLETYWRPGEGIVPRDIRQPGQDWPGLEVPVFLALNPVYMLAMNSEASGLPFLLAPGLRIGSERLPWFDRSGRDFGADCYWDYYRFHGTALVCFGEL